jgi:hypothetical protein
MMEATAARIQAGRQARQPQAAPVEEAPPETPGGLAEIRAHLTAALDLLDNMGAGEEV